MKPVTGIQTEIPTHGSMRKTALKVLGGELGNLWDVPRWDDRGTRSRTAAHSCHKDYKSRYKPWQHMTAKTIKSITDTEYNEASDSFI